MPGQTHFSFFEKARLRCFEDHIPNLSRTLARQHFERLVMVDYNQRLVERISGPALINMSLFKLTSHDRGSN